MKTPSIKKNFIYRMLYELLLIITPFITTPYISRVLESDGVGIYSYTSSIMTFFTMFAALGTATYGTREIAQHRDDPKQSSRLFWEIELMTILTSSAALVVWIVLSIFYTEYRVYLFALTPLLFGTMFDINWYFMGYEKVLYTVLRNSAVKIAGILVLFIFIKEKNDLNLYIFLMSSVNLLGSLSMWTYLPKMLVKVDFRTLRIREHLKQTLVYFIPTIATTVYTVFDKTLIGLITNDNHQNGYYEQAAKLINIIKTVVYSSVNAVMTARISYLYAQEQYDEIRRKIRKSMDFILLLGVGSVCGICGIAQNFVPIFFGKGYEPVEGLIYLMSPLVIIIGISNCLGSQYYTPSGRRAQSAKYIVIGAFINICLNVCMIPFLQARGAVVASLIAEIVITILYVMNCSGYLTAGIIVSLIWKRALAGIIMMSVVFVIGKTNGVSVLVLATQVAAGICIYGVILIILRDRMLFELFGMVSQFIGKLLNHKSSL